MMVYEICFLQIISLCNKNWYNIPYKQKFYKFNLYFYLPTFHLNGCCLGVTFQSTNLFTVLKDYILRNDAFGQLFMRLFNHEFLRSTLKMFGLRWCDN